MSDQADTTDGDLNSQSDRGRVRAVGACALAVLICLLAATAHGQSAAPPIISAQLAKPRTIGSGGWSYFGDPRAICTSYGCFVGWITPRGKVQISRITQHGSHKFTLDAHLGKPDDHNNPSIVATSRGSLMAFWSPHSGRHFPIKSDKPSRIHYRKQSAPGKILRFGAPRSVPRPKRCRYGYTYPNPMWVKGQLFLFIRGCTWQPTLIRRVHQKWTRAKVVVRGKAGQRPYAKYDTDGSRVVMAFTECHVGSCPHNSLFFASYSNGTWRRADGTPIAKMGQLPFKPRAAGEPIYDGAANGGRSWVQDVAFSPSGEPVVLYTVEPHGQVGSSYWYATYRDGAWHRHIIPFGVVVTRGPAGATLDHETPNVAYISRKIAGHDEVSIITTDDDGATWYERRLTSGTASSIRPVSMRHDSGFSVVWLWGKRLSYRRFYTSVRYMQISDTSAFRSGLRRIRPPAG